MAGVMGTLGRYMIRQNTFLLFACLGVGVGVYLLADMFDRMDDFLEAGLGSKVIATYYMVKLPLIISQIIPAVFLISLIVQLSMMARSRELVALRAGGMRPGWLFKFIVFYALFWSLTQLCFSQFLGAYGEREANRIWKEDVRKKSLDAMTMNDIWFREGDFMVHAKVIASAQNTAEGVSVYEFDPESKRLVRVITADSVKITDFGWRMLFPRELDTIKFQAVQLRSMLLPVLQDMEALAAIEHASDRAQLPLLELGRAIRELKESGANVERLLTAWHGKIAYAFTLLVMGLVALAVSSFTEKAYAGVGVSLLILFMHYGVQTVGLSAGQQGVLPPVVGAWAADVITGTLALIRIGYTSSTRVERFLNWPTKIFFPRKAAHR